MLKIKGDFAKNVFKLTAGTAVAQLIPFAASPVISRLFEPNEFALAEMFLRLFSMLVLFSTLRLELAIVLPKKDSDSKALIALITRTSLLVMAIGLVIFGLFGNPIASALGYAELAQYLWLVPITVFVGSLYTTLNYWQIRKKSFGLISYSRAFSSVANSGAKIILGFLFTNSPIGLLVGQAIAFVTGSLVLIKGRMHAIIELMKIDKEAMRRNRKAYSAFPLINLPHALLDAVRDFAIIFIITYYFQDLRAGYYAFAIRLLKTPLAIIGTSISQVFLQRASEMYNEGKSIYGVTLSMVKRLALISIPFFACFAIIAPHIFAFVFGSNWEAAGKVAQVLCIWLSVHFIISPLSQVPLIIKKQLGIFILSFIGAILTTFTLIAFGEGGYSLIDTLLAFSIVQALFLIIVILWTLGKAKVAIKEDV